MPYGGDDVLKPLNHLQPTGRRDVGARLRGRVDRRQAGVILGQEIGQARRRNPEAPPHVLALGCAARADQGIEMRMTMVAQFAVAPELR